MQDILPAMAGSPVIQSYGPDGFRIGNKEYAGHVIVTATEAFAWNGELTLEALAPVLNADPHVEIILFGTGLRHTMLDPALRQALKAREFGMDTMDTGAACRTFNILLGEGRRVAAVLRLPV